MQRDGHQYEDERKREREHKRRGLERLHAAAGKQHEAGRGQRTSPENLGPQRRLKVAAGSHHTDDESGRISRGD